MTPSSQCVSSCPPLHFLQKSEAVCAAEEPLGSVSGVPTTQAPREAAGPELTAASVDLEPPPVRRHIVEECAALGEVSRTARWRADRDRVWRPFGPGAGHGGRTEEEVRAL